MASNRRESPYITIDAEAPLDARWTAPLWFAWSRLLATCRLKESAELRLRTRDATSVLNVSANRVRRTLHALSAASGVEFEEIIDHGGALIVVRVPSYPDHYVPDEVVRLRAEIARNRAAIVAMLLRRDGVGCRRCGSSEPYHVDHVHPLSRGGDNAPENLQLLCAPCNLSKGATYGEAEH